MHFFGCEWLQQKIQKDNPAFEIEVKLPTKHQFIYAAQGGRMQSIYPWGEFYLRNKKHEPRCNFKIVKDEHIYRNRKTGEPEIGVRSTNFSGQVRFTSTVNSYYQNDFKLYNMCGLKTLLQHLPIQSGKVN